MYIRKSIRLYKGKSYTNYVLVESVMTPKGPRQKTICSLGDLSPRPREEWLKLARKIEDALVGQSDLLDGDDGEVADIVRRVRARRPTDERANAERAPPSSPRRNGGGPLIKVDPSRVTTEQHREAGPVHVGYQFWQRLELDRILRDCKLSPAACRLACVMTLNRLIAPSSEHAMPDWIRRTALADILGVDFDELEEDPLYEVLDKLHPHRAAIEAALVARERSLFNLDQTVYLYDLTSTYFEGQCAGKGNKVRVIDLDFGGAYELLRKLPVHLKSKWLFWHHDGEPYRNVSSRFSAMVGWADAAAKKEGRAFQPFTFHHLRHRHAVDWLKSGRSIYDLQQRLGHSSIKVTEMYLDYLTPDEVRAVKQAGPQQAEQQGSA